MAAHSTRVLIVDDSEIVRRAVKALLAAEDSRFVCDEASGGAEALQKAQVLRPAVILLDLSMPGADGLEIARRLRQEAPESAVLILSQNDVSLLSGPAAEVGACGFVDKARISTDLLATIERILPDPAL